MGQVTIRLNVEDIAQHLTSSTVQFGYTDEAPFPPVVVAHDMKSDNLFFSLEDCSPDLSVGADLRLRNLASTLISDLTKTFQNDLEGIFKQHGRLPSGLF